MVSNMYVTKARRDVRRHDTHARLYGGDAVRKAARRYKCRARFVTPFAIQVDRLDYLMKRSMTLDHQAATMFFMLVNQRLLSARGRCRRVGVRSLIMMPIASASEAAEIAEHRIWPEVNQR